MNFKSDFCLFDFEQGTKKSCPDLLFSNIFSLSSQYSLNFAR